MFEAVTGLLVECKATQVICLDFQCYKVSLYFLVIKLCLFHPNLLTVIVQGLAWLLQFRFFPRSRTGMIF
mgnify:CR=1 FL=1